MWYVGKYLDRYFDSIRERKLASWFKWTLTGTIQYHCMQDDNLFVVDETWNGDMLMPRIGSEDNYVIDTIQLQFFYTCLDPDPVSYVVSSDASYCNYVNISWENPEDTSLEFINIYRDNNFFTLIYNIL